MRLGASSGLASDGRSALRRAVSRTIWVVDLDSLERVKSPDSGTDILALNQYLSTRKRSVITKWKNISTFVIEEEQLNIGEGIVVALAYDRNWKAEGNNKLERDALGNILVYPEDTTGKSITLTYRKIL